MGALADAAGGHRPRRARRPVLRPRRHRRAARQPEAGGVQSRARTTPSVQQRLWAVSEELTGVTFARLMRTVEEHQRVVADLIAARAPGERRRWPRPRAWCSPPTWWRRCRCPVFDNSAMDGYAVRAEDVAGADDRQPGETACRRRHSGRPHRPAHPGAGHRAPDHDRCARCRPAPRRWCRSRLTDGGTETVEIRATPRAGQHLRRAGEDVTAGTTVLRAGQLVTPAALGLGRRTRARRTDGAAAPAGAGDVDRLGAGVGRHRTASPARSTSPTPSCWPPRCAKPAARWWPPRRRATTSTQFRTVLEGYAGQADLIITTGGVSAGAYEVVKDAFGGSEVSSSSRWRCSPACRRARAAWAAPRSSRCRATRSARWCPSRCSSGPPCARRWACRTRSGRGATPCSPKALTSPTGKRQFRRGVLRPGRGHGHHLRAAGLASSAVAGLGELPAGDRRGRHRDGGRRAGPAMGPFAEPDRT